MHTLTTILLVCSTILPGVSAAESNISLVTADLSVLARVTNAIYLVSNDVFDDPNNVYRAISEIGRFNSTALSLLMELEVDSVIPIIQEIRSMCDEMIQKKFTNGNSDVVDNFNELLQNGLRMLVNDSLLDQSDVNVDELLAAPHWTEFNPLNHSALESIIAFRRADKADRVLSEYIENELLLRLPESLFQLRHDVGFFKDFPTTSKKSKLRKSLSKLTSLLKIQQIFVGIASDADKIEQFSSKLGWVKESFGLIAPYLRNITDNKMREKISKVKEVYAAVVGTAQEDRTLTNGFLEARDMGRVVSDVNSKWFREKVAKGKSTAELARALEPLQRIGERMGKLHNARARFGSVVNVSYSTAEVLQEFTATFECIETHPSVSTISTVLNNAESAIAKCRKNMVPLKNAQFSRFRDAIYSAYKIETSLNELSDLVTSFLASINGVEDFTRNLDYFRQNVREYYRSNVKDARSFWKELLGNPGFGPQLRSAFDSLEPIYAKQNELSSLIAQFGKLKFTSEDIDLKTVIESSKIDEFFLCLKADNYDAGMIRDLSRLQYHVKMMTDATYYEFYPHFTLLSSVQKLVKGVQNVTTQLSRKSHRVRRATAGLFAKLNVSETWSVQLGNAVAALSKMNRTATADRKVLERCTRLSETAFEVARHFHDSSVRDIWGDERRAREHIKHVLGSLDSLNMYCGTIFGKYPMEMTSVFMEATKVTGVPVKQELFDEIIENLRKAFAIREADAISELKRLEIDFASYKSDLTGAGPAMTALQTMFDEYFGNSQKTASQVVKVQQVHSSAFVLTIVGICLGVFVLILVLSCVGYGFTRNGRNRYTNLYLYYFGKPEDFEKRWRYSMFRDRTDGENALIDATREINLENVLKALRKGAYINVYNKFGNTPLHTVARLGHADLVAALIRNGADRTLLNARNRTAEQMIPAEKEEKFAECERIFAKYRSKKFRVRVPEVFPVSSFHIYIEERTDDALTDEFMNKFRAITSEELLMTNTHCVVKVDEQGILVTEDIRILFGIFNGVIIVKDSWMADCVRDEKLIEQDQRYLVESVKYKGVLFENVVLPWTEAKAKSTMPFLYGVFAVFVMEVCPNIETLSSIITGNGGKVLDAFPDKSQFNQGSHPYLHAHLGPLFVIHDGKTPGLMALKKDPMFTVLTEDELIAFLLKRQINRDTRNDPIPVVSEERASQYSSYVQQQQSRTSMRS